MSEHQEELGNERIAEGFIHAAELLAKNKSDRAIIESLVEEKGFNQEDAENILRLVLKKQTQEVEESDDDGSYSWLIYIGILVLINVLSYMFDWPFWIY